MEKGHHYGVIILEPIVGVRNSFLRTNGEKLTIKCLFKNKAEKNQNRKC